MAITLEDLDRLAASGRVVLLSSRKTEHEEVWQRIAITCALDRGRYPQVLISGCRIRKDSTYHLWMLEYLNPKGSMWLLSKYTKSVKEAKAWVGF